MNPQEQASSELTAQPVKSETKKCNHMVIIVILAILAVGGFVFGGVELWQNIQNNNKLNELQSQINQEASDGGDDVSTEDRFVLHFSDYMFGNVEDGDKVEFYGFDKNNCVTSQSGACNEVMNKDLAERVSVYECETSSCRVWQWAEQKGTAVAGDYAVIYEGADYLHGQFDYCVVYDIKNEKVVYRGDNGVKLTISEYGESVLNANGDFIGRFVSNADGDFTVSL